MKLHEKLGLVTFFILHSTVCESADSFSLSIIHLSDFHSRYMPVSPKGGLCYSPEACVGGIARISSIVSSLKQTRPNPIFLNAGDNFQGTLYYELFRGAITSYFMNELPHDVMTIGNHDFDDGISGFVSYVRQLKAPVVVSNIDSSAEPSITKNLYASSQIITRGGKNIGVIGVINSETDKISSTTGKLQFLDEVASVNAEAERLKAQGVSIIVVLSHCGIYHDKIIAEQCPDIDVIIGGHSHILLYNGKPPGDDVAFDKYPIAIKQQKGNRTVLIAHAGAFTKYMGDITINFDEKDEVASWKGNPIYLDKSVEEDPSILEKLKPWKVTVDKVGKVEIAESRVYLNGSCASGDCNFANLITDAMVDKFAANATLSLNSALNLQNSIPAGKILYEDIYMSLPYNNTWTVIEMEGKDLLQVLEENVAKSASGISFVNYKLLHWAGLKVTYNLTNEPLSRVVSVKVRSLENPQVYEKLELEQRYRIVAASYLLTQAFATIQKKHRVVLASSDLEYLNLMDYVRKSKVIDIKTESRMIFV